MNAATSIEMTPEASADGSTGADARSLPLTTTKNSALYTEAFFKSQRSGSRRTADLVVPILQRLMNTRSVLDVGCGVGPWLAAWRAAGVHDVLGIDGEHVKLDALEIPRASFRTHDLATPLRIDRTFDLAMSLEVGEHLPTAASQAFVDLLTHAAPAVLFSAAIPCQGGVGHVNEQWQSWWADLFSTRGFVAVDCVRPAIWSDESAEWWYAQNAILYVRHDMLDRHETLRSAWTAARHQPLDVVHPQQFVLAALDSLRLKAVREK